MLKKGIKQYFAIEINENTPLKNEASIKLWRVTERPQKRVELLKYKFVARFYALVFKEFIKEAEEEFSLSKRTCGLVLPRSSFITRLMELPAAHRKELRKMISLQVGHMLPYDFDDIIFDFLNFTKKENGQIPITLFVITKQVLAKFVNPLKECKITPTFVIPSTTLISKTYLSLISDPANDVHIFVDVDSDVAEVVVTQGKRVALTRNMNFSPGNTDEFVDQILFSLEKEDVDLAGTKVRFILFNQRRIFEAVSPRFRERFPQAVVQTINYNSALNKIRIVQKPTDITEAISLSSGIGLVLGKIADVVDLLPDEIRSQKLQQLTFRKMCITLLLMIVLCGLSALYFVSDYTLKSRFRNEITAAEKEISSETKEATEVLKGMDVILEVQAKKQLPLDVVNELYMIIPSGIFLTFFDYDVEDGVKIRGMAKQLSDVSDLVLKFQRSLYFDDVEMKFAKKRVENNEKFIDFQIDCLLMGGSYD